MATKKVLKKEYDFAKNLLKNFKNYFNAKYIEIPEEEYNQLFELVQLYKKFDSLLFTPEELQKIKNGCCGGGSSSNSGSGNTSTLDPSDGNSIIEKIISLEKTMKEIENLANDTIDINDGVMDLDGIK